MDDVVSSEVSPRRETARVSTSLLGIDFCFVDSPGVGIFGNRNEMQMNVWKRGKNVWCRETSSCTIV